MLACTISPMLERFSHRETPEKRLENLENITPEEASKKFLDSKAWPTIAIIATALAMMASYKDWGNFPIILQAGSTATVATLANCGRHWSKHRRLSNRE
jgi:hypothetical protein